MLVIGEKIIAYLLDDDTLVTMLGGDNINSAAVQDKNSQNIRVSVDTNAGQDMNYVPVDQGSITIIASVNRSVEQAATLCYNIAKRIDILLNRAETALSDTTYKVLNFCRDDSSGLMVSDYTQELYFSLTYSYLLESDATN
jgi:hypothetical protein